VDRDRNQFLSCGPLEHEPEATTAVVHDSPTHIAVDHSLTHSLQRQRTKLLCRRAAVQLQRDPKRLLVFTQLVRVGAIGSPVVLLLVLPECEVHLVQGDVAVCRGFRSGCKNSHWRSRSIQFGEDASVFHFGFRRTEFAEVDGFSLPVSCGYADVSLICGLVMEGGGLNVLSTRHRRLRVLASCYAISDVFSPRFGTSEGKRNCFG
jgi:hypothetical protein